MEHLLVIAGVTEQYVFLILIAFIVFALILVYIWDVTQKSNAILRNYPIIGHVRFIAERLGVYLRQYFYARDREELPFNRDQREWVYRAAANVDTTVGFGSTRDLSRTGAVLFVDAPFPVLGQDAAPTRPITFGSYTKHPYTASSILNISAMSYGALSKNAVRALSHGAKMAGCWMDTGEGGLTSYHLEGGCDLVAEIGTAKFGYRHEDGSFSKERLLEAASHPQV